MHALSRHALGKQVLSKQALSKQVLSKQVAAHIVAGRQQDKLLEQEVLLVASKVHDQVQEPRIEAH